MDARTFQHPREGGVNNPVPALQCVRSALSIEKESISVTHQKLVMALHFLLYCTTLGAAENKNVKKEKNLEGKTISLPSLSVITTNVHTHAHTHTKHLSGLRLRLAQLHERHLLLSRHSLRSLLLFLKNPTTERLAYGILLLF